MNRRGFIGATASVCLVAGCLTPPGDTSGQDDDPTVTDREFEVTSSSCGTGEQRADVAFDADVVVVTGAIAGANTCYTATLEAASYDEEADELTVAVASEDRSDGSACAQCIVDVEYEARVTFSGGLPGHVVVHHDGEQVTTTDRT